MADCHSDCSDINMYNFALEFSKRSSKGRRVSSLTLTGTRSEDMYALADLHLDQWDKSDAGKPSASKLAIMAVPHML